MAPSGPGRFPGTRDLTPGQSRRPALPPSLGTATATLRSLSGFPVSFSEPSVCMHSSMAIAAPPAHHLCQRQLVGSQQEPQLAGQGDTTLEAPWSTSQGLPGPAGTGNQGDGQEDGAGGGSWTVGEGSAVL